MVRIPDSHRDLLQKPACAHLATVMPDGSAQVSSVAIDFDGEHVLANPARVRLKDRPALPWPDVALSIMDPDNPCHGLLVRGHIVEVSEEDADRAMSGTAQPGGSLEKPTRRRRRRRVIYKITPEHVTPRG